MIVLSNGGITYSPNNTNPIIIKVSGGSTSADSYGDYWTFKDVNNNSIHLADGSFKFMRGKQYQFVADGINTSYDFELMIDFNETNSISGSSGVINALIPNNIETDQEFHIIL